MGEFGRSSSGENRVESERFRMQVESSSFLDLSLCRVMLHTFDIAVEANSLLASYEENKGRNSTAEALQSLVDTFTDSLVALEDEESRSQAEERGPATLWAGRARTALPPSSRDSDFDGAGSAMTSPATSYSSAHLTGQGETTLRTAVQKESKSAQRIKTAMISDINFFFVKLLPIYTHLH